MGKLICHGCGCTDYEVEWTPITFWLKCKGCGFRLELDLTKGDRDFLEVMISVGGKD